VVDEVEDDKEEKKIILLTLPTCLLGKSGDMHLRTAGVVRESQGGRERGWERGWELSGEEGQNGRGVPPSPKSSCPGMLVGCCSICGQTWLPTHPIQQRTSFSCDRIVRLAYARVTLHLDLNNRLFVGATR
jgi:hypothetical protein